MPAKTNIGNSLGFTLLEILIGMAIILVVLSMSTLNMSRFLKQSTLANSVQEITSVLSSAKSKSLSGQAGMSYKVSFSGSSAILKTQSGTTLSTLALDSSVEILPPASDITFASVTGYSNGGNLTVRLKDLSSSIVVTVSTLGAITSN